VPIVAPVPTAALVAPHRRRARSFERRDRCRFGDGPNRHPLLQKTNRAVYYFDTIVLLLGMMIVVANLPLSRFFRVITHWIEAYVRRPITLLGMVIFSSGVLSAFLVNDTICLVMTLLVLELVTRLKQNPIPCLLAIATASNIGSVATITGNPQNIIIGSLSRIPYGDFAAALVPVAVIGLMITSVLIALSYRSEFFTRDRDVFRWWAIRS